MREKKHKISIIIPAYNEEKFLPLCLKSISKLDWPKENLEVIVIDNGSEDNTCRIAESFGVILLKNDKTTVSGLRNLGAHKATGNILAFVDADCIVAEDWLIQAEKYFDNNTISAWGSPPEIPEDSTWVQKAWLIVRQKQKKIETVDWLESMNLFTRKEKFIKISGFDESLITCEDVDFSYRISKYGSIIADQSIKVQHLGEADTLKVFIKKELWRGKGNYKGVFKHGFKLKELPSIAMPIYFGLFLPILIAAALFNSNLAIISFTLLAVVFPGVLTLFKVRNKRASMVGRMQLFFLIYIYFIVRTVAIVPYGND